MGCARVASLIVASFCASFACNGAGTGSAATTAGGASNAAGTSNAAGNTLDGGSHGGSGAVNGAGTMMPVATGGASNGGAAGSSASGGASNGGNAASSAGGASNGGNNGSSTGGASSGGAAGSSASGSAGDGGSAEPGKRYGFTLDAVDDVANIVDSLSRLPERALVRVVFDYPEPPSTYRAAIDAIVPHADVVGQPDAAFDVIKSHGKRVLFTPYWNEPDCADTHGDYLAWTEKNISDKVKTGTDLVAVSIYGTDCAGPEPTYAELDSMFVRLASMFPNAQLGIGEYGAKAASDKERVLRYYLDYSNPAPRYVFWGGYWYGHQDFVPATKPLWKVFADAMR